MAKAKAKPVFVNVLSAESVDELNGCCGIEVLSGLSTRQYEVVSAKAYKRYESEDTYYYGTPEDDGITTVTRARELSDAIRDVDGNAAIATTIPKQKKEIAALKEAGFISLKSFTNPGTRNVVTIWYRAPR